MGHGKKGRECLEVRVQQLEGGVVVRPVVQVGLELGEVFGVRAHQDLVGMRLPQRPVAQTYLLESVQQHRSAKTGSLGVAAHNIGLGPMG